MLKRNKIGLLVLLTASSLLWNGCSLNHYKNAANCRYTLAQGSSSTPPISGIYLGNRSVAFHNLLSNSFSLLAMLSSPEDYPLTIGLNFMVENPNPSAARIDKLDVAFFVDRDGNSKFTPQEQIEVRLFLNCLPDQVVQSQEKYLSTNPPKTTKFVVGGNAQQELPVVLILPNIKQQMREHGLMTSLFSAMMKGDMSRLSLKIRPYVGQVAMPKWIDIDLNQMNKKAKPKPNQPSVAL